MSLQRSLYAAAKTASVALAVASASFVLAANAVLTELGNADSIAAGYLHACVLTSGGGVKCWGDNSLGQLGDGTTATRYTAAYVSGLSSGVSAIDASHGGFRTCAITSSGAVKCWGDSSLIPEEVSGIAGAPESISVGRNHACVIVTGGALQCWGGNEYGQLGNGTQAFSATPTSVSGLAAGVLEVSAGYEHTCAVVAGGGAACWGRNFAGQLGDGTTINRLTPTSVSSLSSGVVSISAGGVTPGSLNQGNGGYTCAVTSAGGAKCWGDNSFGQLGDGTATHHLTPFDVLGLTSGVAKIATGGYGAYNSAGRSTAAIAHTCAVTVGGSISCWGANFCYMVSPALPVMCSTLPINGWAVTPTPTEVAGLSSGMKAVATGGDFTCAITPESGVKCWGWRYNENISTILTGTTAQAITFGPAPTIAVAGTGPMSAIGGQSGNPIVYTSLTPATCSVFGATVSGLAQGLCTIAANQSGNDAYDPAPQVTLTFMIGDRFSQTISFSSTPSLLVGVTGPLSATASSALPVSFTSNTPSICVVSSGVLVTGLVVGTCTIAASQPGNIEFGPAPEVTLNIPVDKGVQNINFTSTPPQYPVPGGAPYVVSAIGGASGNPVVFSIDAGSTIGACSIIDAVVSFTGVGNCIVTAGQQGNSNYQAAGLALQTISVVLPASIPRLANISTRMQVLTGADVLIGGFIIGGTQAKTVVVRARGTSLRLAGLNGALLQNPLLQLFSGQSQIAFNDDWGQAANAAALQSSGFAPLDTLESAILTTLSPGAYTAIVSGVGFTTGVGIVEVFEVDLPQIPLINIATRGRVGSGDDVMIGGFVIQGDSPQTVIVRARGPSLTAAGVPGALQDPILQLHSAQTQTVFAGNDDWQVQAVPADVAAIQSSGLAPSDTREAVIRVTLPPGAYTAIVTGKNGASGVGIVEVFAQ